MPTKARGWTAHRLIARGVPLALAGSAGRRTGVPAWLAGRALSADNRVVFSEVFVLQWGLGGAIDALHAFGGDLVSAYRGTFALLAVCGALSYLWFLWRDDCAAQQKSESDPRTVDNPPPCPD
jgi:hypothetical protein